MFLKPAQCDASWSEKKAKSLNVRYLIHVVLNPSKHTAILSLEILQTDWSSW